MTVLDDLGLVLTGKPAGSQVKPATGTGTGTAKNTRGLPMQFTMEAWGFQKNVYMFKDLKEFFDHADKKGKGKGKGKEGKASGSGKVKSDKSKDKKRA